MSISVHGEAYAWDWLEASAGDLNILNPLYLCYVFITMISLQTMTKPHVWFDRSSFVNVFRLFPNRCSWNNSNNNACPFKILRFLVLVSHPYSSIESRTEWLAHLRACMKCALDHTKNLSPFQKYAITYSSPFPPISVSSLQCISSKHYTAKLVPTLKLNEIQRSRLG
jgi:hypothetical protein